MDNNFDTQFKKLRDSMQMTDEENSYRKNEVLRFMQSHEQKENRGVLSPFNFHFFPKAKFAVAGFAFLLFFTTGLVSSAKSALPNQYLYVFKINVIEPMQVFLAWNEKDRNEARVALIGQRLEDFNKVSMSQKLSDEDKAVFADSFSLKIKEVQEEITKLAMDAEVSDALSTANDLQSVLTAHSVVLDKIRETENKDARVMELSIMMVPDDLETNIDAGIDATEEIIGDLTAKLQSTEEAANLDEALVKQKDELTIALTEAKTEAEEFLKGNEDDKDYIERELMEIEDLLEEGEETTQSNNKKQTLNIYNEVDQKLVELKTLLGSSKKLGIDVIGESEIEGEIQLMNTIVPDDQAPE